MSPVLRALPLAQCLLLRGNCIIIFFFMLLKSLDKNIICNTNIWIFWCHIPKTPIANINIRFCVAFVVVFDHFDFDDGPSFRLFFPFFLFLLIFLDAGKHFFVIYNTLNYYFVYWQISFRHIKIKLAPIIRFVFFGQIFFFLVCP